MRLSWLNRVLMILLPYLNKAHDCKKSNLFNDGIIPTRG